MKCVEKTYSNKTVRRFEEPLSVTAREILCVYLFLGMFYFNFNENHRVIFKFM